jgi:hypothetical protein
MDTQEQWARLIAYAWKKPDILDALRENPKEEIERLKEEKPEGLGDISGLGGGTEGYFGIPDVPEGLEDLDKNKLEKFLLDNAGIFGIMQLCCA